MWRTERGECAVVIDIPELPTQKFIPAAQASMLDIKRAAFEVLMSCVVNGDHLGGITHTGVGKHLQVRIEAVEPESLGGYASEAET